ncbi:MAG: metallophosphoesterase family protein [Desulfocucumaceae bacterium]
MSCLHRTHLSHLAENNRVCLKCSEEELRVPNLSEGTDSITILQLSDVHFRREANNAKVGLKNWLAGIGAHYVLISGDLTGSAKKEEYDLAAAWIREVEENGARVAVVPGNHDIGYWGNAGSVGRQLTGAKYHWWTKIIDRPLEPCLRGPSFMSLGLNTAHGISSAGFVNGYLNTGQRARAKELLQVTPKGHLKVVFCHHPLIRFESGFHKEILRGATAVEEMVGEGADLLLWGHQHSFNATLLERPEGKCLTVQCPTFSERTRQGGRPGFVVVEWLFNKKAVVKAYRIEENSTIKEDKRVEYPLGGR